jgi:hypothetical protein
MNHAVLDLFKSRKVKAILNTSTTKMFSKLLMLLAISSLITCEWNVGCGPPC